MTKNERFGRGIVVGIFGGVIGFWLVRALISASCNISSIFGNSVDADGTIFIAAIGIGSASFIFGYCLSEKPDQFEKFAVLTTIVWVVLWVGYVLLDEGVCSAHMWRKYLTLLIIPTVLTSVILVGRRWIGPDDK